MGSIAITVSPTATDGWMIPMEYPSDSTGQIRLRPLDFAETGPPTSSISTLFLLLIMSSNTSRKSLKRFRRNWFALLFWVGAVEKFLKEIQLKFNV